LGLAHDLVGTSQTTWAGADDDDIEEHCRHSFQQSQAIGSEQPSPPPDALHVRGWISKSAAAAASAMITT
jgi:hypothetical protein